MADIAVKETQKQKTFSTSWSAKQALVVSTIAYFVAQIFVVLPLIVYGLLTQQDPTSEDFIDQPWVSLVLTGISALGLISTLGVFFRYKRIKFKLLGFNKVKVSQMFLVPLIYVIYIFGLALVMGAVAAVFPEFNAEQVQEVGFKNAEGWQLLLAFVGLVVIAPIAEEMLFRGFLYKGLKNHGGNRSLLIYGLAGAILAVVSNSIDVGLVVALLTIISAYVIQKNHKLGAAIFTSMLFGLVHLQWNVAIDTFILSFALIWLFERTGSIWPSIGLHALKNLVAFVFVFEIISIPGI